VDSIFGGLLPHHRHSEPLFGPDGVSLVVTSEVELDPPYSGSCGSMPARTPFGSPRSPDCRPSDEGEVTSPATGVAASAAC
jgi:hypothetical protein